MGLSTWAARVASGAAHVLVVEAPGRWRMRVHVEEAVRRAGWHLARSPADADVLLVCGHVAGDLGEVVERLWDQLPGPRVRRTIERVADIDGALVGAAAELADTARHRADALSRTQRPALPDGGHMDPGGIPLAEGADDRDGLEMDVLHVPLGPVLPGWPAGLVLTCTLHGDVVAHAEATVLAGDVEPDGDDPAVRLTDAVAGLLALAGDRRADEVRRIRDDLVRGARPDAPARHLDRIRRGVRRSRGLRWSLRGIGVLDEETAHGIGLEVDLVGDSHDRLLTLLERAVGVLRGDPDWPSLEPTAPSVLADAAATVVRGLDLAAARLAVASLGMPSVADREPPEVRDAG